MTSNPSALVKIAVMITIILVIVLVSTSGSGGSSHSSSSYKASKNTGSRTVFVLTMFIVSDGESS